MIFGRPGSGKSTFALELHKATGLPLHHLDKHFFEANWAERDYEEFLTIQSALVAQDRWIIDGNMTKSLDMRYARADLVLYFNYPRWLCFWRIFLRRFNKNQNIADRAEGCGEIITWGLLRYTWGFESRFAQQILDLKLEYPGVRFMELRSDRDVEKLVL